MSNSALPAGDTPLGRQGAGDYLPPYPLYICLSGQPVVVVGAGEVALRKIQALLEHGASVRVVAPQATPAVRDLDRDGAVRWERRPYREGDLAGALLAVVATSDPQVNRAAFQEASARAMLVNVVDVPQLCNAIVPSVMRRGRLQVAVSTDGASPEVAKEVRRDIEERYPAWWEGYLDVLAQMRLMVKDRVPGQSAARAPLMRALARDEALRAQAAAGQPVDPEQVWDRVVAPLLADARQDGRGLAADEPDEEGGHAQGAAEGRRSL